MDCQAAKSFFAEHGVDVRLRDVHEEAVRDEMQARFGRVGTPVIVVGTRVFWGFEDNRADIGDLMGIGSGGGAE